jgi:hypothetical protein
MILIFQYFTSKAKRAQAQKQSPTTGENHPHKVELQPNHKKLKKTKRAETNWRRDLVTGADPPEAPTTTGAEPPDTPPTTTPNFNFSDAQSNPKTTTNQTSTSSQSHAGKTVKTDQAYHQNQKKKSPKQLPLVSRRRGWGQTSSKTTDQPNSRQKNTRSGQKP